MIKINKNSIVFGFLLLAALGMGSFAKTTYAQEVHAYNPPINDNNSAYNQTNTTSSQNNSQANSNINNGNNGQTSYVSNGYNAAPLIYSTSPNYIKAGSGDITINVIGNNFVSSSIVRYNGSDRPTTYISSTQLSAKLNANDTTNMEKYPVTVFTPAPGGGISNTVAFIVNDGTPVASLNMYSSDLAMTGSTVGNSANTGTNGNGIVADSGTAGNPSTTTNNTTNNSINKNLTANASNGFFPWGFLFWVLLAIAILFAIIIWRQYLLNKNKEEKAKPDIVGEVSAIVDKEITVIGTEYSEDKNPDKINISYTVDATNAEIKNDGKFSELSDISIGDNLEIYGTITNTSISANMIEKLPKDKEHSLKAHH